MVSGGLCKVKFFGGLREKAGQAAFDMETGTVRELLACLVNDNEALEKALFEEQALRPHVRVMLNGRDIELGDGLETAVNENDQLAVFPPIGGG